MKAIWRRSLLLTGLGAVIIAASVFIAYEMRTSALQARSFSALSSRLTYRIASGPSPTIRFPNTGPYDERLGYTALPALLDRLTAQHYTIAKQARLSPSLQQAMAWGLFPIYDEKTQAGLHIWGRHDELIFAALHPQRIYLRFEDIPRLIVDTLLLIENRELLNANYPHRNPVVEWDRLGRAMWDAMRQVVAPDQNAAGGSTLATQLEKFRHSPGGRTDTAMEKLRQMLTASLRAYRHGKNTLPAQRDIILDYLNALPLAAQVGYGEVHSLGDGLWAWYGSDFDHINRVLSEPPVDHEHLAAYALAYKQVLSLLLAHRRPSFYLRQNSAALTRQTDRYLYLVTQAGLISPALRDMALQIMPLPVRHRVPDQPPVSFVERKAANAVRHHLASLLGVAGLYALDRLDLEVQSTLDPRSQHAVTDRLQQWHSKAAIKADGLTGPRLLHATADPAKVRYSLILYERVGAVNLLRVHTDNLNQPFDLNHGIKLDLGSTAKLRTLITYLEIVAALHERYATMAPKERHAIRVHPDDRLSQWVLDYLVKTPDSSLLRILDAAMARRYSANPKERFFTGGGIHEFVNFDRRDDTREMSVRKAFRHSVNLVFIRLMRDIAQYYTAQLPEVVAEMKANQAAMQRQPKREAQDGVPVRQPQPVVRQFVQRYAQRRPAAIMDALIARIHPTPQRFAALYGALKPKATLAEFRAFLRARFPHPNLTERVIASLFTRFVSATHTWESRGALTALSPDELRVAAYAYRYPKAKQHELLAAVLRGQPATKQRRVRVQPRRAAVDLNTRIKREEQAFAAIHNAWQRLGYPFASLVPSYATAIGSSADRPDALAELIGIVANDGIRYPTRHIEKLHFASGTPYETLLMPQDRAQTVLHPAIAAVVKEALYDVVERGTGRRLRGAFQGEDGRIMRVGGKTGTGDHRDKTFGAGGELISSRVVNRAAALVFMIDERFFGTLTAYVPGPDAADYQFTSSLTTQALKRLASTLDPLFHEGGR
ncbi:transglycosylase domain-containing protein [Candidatus Entotheonella palauensis]|uniref:transglycosylase domain-containing protein n=1 Tax=Candidatus Entotheonella palauensis TaxID=93172 RepID=UPI000B7E77A8|nr:transglycosylase domain-containing protein [Candidatus Entotheonella palauensis]